MSRLEEVVIKRCGTSVVEMLNQRIFQLNLLFYAMHAPDSTLGIIEFIDTATVTVVKGELKN